MSGADPNPYESPQSPLGVLPAVPRPARPWPVWLVVLLAVMVPGVPSVGMLGWRRGGLRFLLLLFAVPIALVLFGPVWDQVIFAQADRQTRDFGLWPFLATLVLTPVASTVVGLLDRRRAVRQMRAFHAEMDRGGSPFGPA